MAIENKIGRIGVLMGGPSAERDISLKSGKAVYEALKNAGVDVVPIDILCDSIEENIRLIESQKIDCAFLALHGRFGEDGQVQGLLDSINIPYTGSGQTASALAMDKVASRRIFEANNIPTPRYKIAEKNSRSADTHAIKIENFPVVVKPVTCGSSIGLSIVQSESGLKKALELAFNFDEKALIEEYISGREMTVGILEEEALPVIEIMPKKAFFDFEAKYQAGMTDYTVPAKLDKSTSKKLQAIALKAHKALGCHGCSRADIMIGRMGEPYVLELNTIPGLTQTSLLPKGAKVVGIEFTQLCFKLINLAYGKKQK